MIKPNGIISLLTDFGDKDGFIGTMKGVIYGINPRATIVDITHQIPPQDVNSGAFVLKNCYHYFPKGTIHVAVVDPGVGSERKILLTVTPEHFFIAPDNHILKYIFYSQETIKVFEVFNKKYFLKTVSHTFHGRDIFAPVAAYLSTGIPVDEFGREIQDYDKGDIALPQINRHKISGSIIYIDQFGNLITNIEEHRIKSRKISINLGTQTVNSLSNSYAEVETGEPLALIGSSGFLEIAIRNGNAQKAWNVNIGDPVIIEIK